MMHLAIAFVLFIIIPFALVGAAALWEHLTNDSDTDNSDPRG
jgi:hypothetical protein